MDKLINPYSVMISFAVMLIALDLFRPRVSRGILGFFFLAMAFVVNVPTALAQPEIFAEAGRNAFLPVYRWFFSVVIAWNPPLFVYPLILFEIGTGLLILNKGRWTRLGLIFGTLFCLFLAPLGKESLTTPLLALAIGLLLRVNFDQTVLDDLIRRFRKKEMQTI